MVLTIILVTLAILTITFVFFKRPTRAYAEHYFAGRRILLTGASEGIGAELALQLAEMGSRIVICARRLEKLEGVRSSILERVPGAEIKAIRCDLAIESDCKNLVDESLVFLGGIDTVILNAAVSMYDMIVDLQPSEACKLATTITNANYLGNVYLTTYLLPYLRDGSVLPQIVPVSSLSGLMGTPLVSFYAASKHALQGFYEALRVELEMDLCDIQITLLRLGMISSETAVKATSGANKVKYHSVEQSAKDMISAIASRVDEAVISHPFYQVLFLRLFSVLLPSVIRWTVRGVMKESMVARRDERDRQNVKTQF